ncbi:MAG TPA: hypothetical protein VMS31_17450 [Pyrinomonadaceae bacterium]|nr:hypothetical protein [Pyrinomonadaceae bacterium]
MGWFDAGIAELKLAHELDPLSLIISTDLAKVYLGDKDQAFRWFDRVFEERASGGAISINVSFVWDNLRLDPRYAQLEQRDGF